MVAIPDVMESERVSPRLLRVLREVEVPGDDVDHRWMGRRIQAAAETLSERLPRGFSRDLVLSGWLRELGLDPARSAELEGRCFPDAWLDAVSPLLRCGFPVEGWRLVEAGLLSYEPGAVDARRGWRLHLGKARESLGDWHELGESLLLGVVVRGLAAVVGEQGAQTRVRVVGVNRNQARVWARRLRNELRGRGLHPPPHIVGG